MSKLRELSRELGAEIIYFIPSENEVVLIDDIYTTGSTLEACAGELKKAGVSEIYSACLCIGRDY